MSNLFWFIGLPGVPQDHRSAYLCMAAEALHEKYSSWHQRVDLDHAIDLARRAAVGSESPLHVATLLGAVMERLQRHTQDTDLDEAAAAASRLVVVVEDPAERAVFGLIACNLHFRRFTEKLDMSALDPGIEAGRAFVWQPPENVDEYSEGVDSFVRMLQARCELTGDAASTGEAIAAGEHALELLPPGHEHRASHTHELGLSWVARFSVTADVACLDTGIQRYREALRMAIVVSDKRAIGGASSMLCGVLRLRFERSGRRADIEEAVDCGRVAVKHLASRERAGARAQLCAALTTTFIWTRNDAALDEAVEEGRRAVRGLPAEAPERAAALANLGLAIRARHEDTAEPGRRWRRDLDEAIQCESAAATAASGRSLADWAAFLMNQAATLRLKYDIGKDKRDLYSATGVITAVLQLLPEDHPARASVLVTKADIATRLNDAGEVDPAAPHPWLTVARTATAPIDDRVLAAYRAAEFAASHGRWDEATEAYSLAVELLPLLAWAGLRRDDGERRLLAWQGLACDAAASAISAGRPGLALELLELGRTVLWSRAQAHKSDFTALNERHPDLAAELAGVRALIDSGTVDAGQVIDLGRRWEGAMDAIRACSGFEDFGRPPAITDLLTAAAVGPIVVVNVSRWRCDALVVTKDSVRVVTLSDLAEADVRRQTQSYLTAMLGLDSGAQRPDSALLALLEWLGDRIGQPVLDVLRPSSDNVRVWWCPTGLLTLLPLHAAQVTSRNESFRRTPRRSAPCLPLGPLPPAAPSRTAPLCWLSLCRRHPISMTCPWSARSSAC
jgi:HEPN domain-containing protein